MSNKAKKCDILLVGGGSGGHFTPLVTISKELKKLWPESRIVHIGQTGDRLNSIVDVPTIDERYTISAGKFRRYNGETFIHRIFDIKTLLCNVRDFFRFIRGILQAWWLLGKLRPEIIFTKGGYVCAPVGIAASWRKIPYITHDSDAMVSLAHRVIAKHAKLHLTAMKPELYLQYDQRKTIQVGVPIRSEFHKVTAHDRASARIQLSIPNTARVLFVVGGGLGAQKINDAIINSSKELLVDPNVQILHITGHKLFDSVMSSYSHVLNAEELKRVHCVPFSNEVDVFGAASDVVVTRAGATNVAELAAQALACIIVPNPLLSGGHQLKNAHALEQTNAVLIVKEGDSQNLLAQIKRLFNDDKLRYDLAERLHKTSQNNAAEKIAKLLYATVFENEQGGETDEVSSKKV